VPDLQPDPQPNPPSRPNRLLGRVLHADEHPEVRDDVLLLTVARLVANGTLRYTAPFLPAIGRGLGVPLTSLGVAVTAGELAGLTAPLAGRRVDRTAPRTAMTVALALVALGALVAGVSPGVGALAVGLFLVSAGKVAYDVTLSTWIADRVPFERRGTVVGITELSWAGGMLLAVPLLGVVVALSSWRWGYGVAAAAMGVTAIAVFRRVRAAAPAHHRDGDQVRAAVPRLPAAAWRAIAGLGCLMGASTAAFVTFGSWLEDVHGFGALGLGGVALLLGLGELASSASTIRFTDRWGKSRSVRLGAGVMVPAALVVAAFGGSLVLGLGGLLVFIMGFEFAIVSFLPLISELRPSARAATIGLALAVGTLGRGLVAIPATWLYDRHGMGASMALGGALALLVMASLIGRRG
jgi:MFS transporter, DHA1 family, inner membrane transport protein